MTTQEACDAAKSALIAAGEKFTFGAHDSDADYEAAKVEFNAASAVYLDARAALAAERATAPEKASG